MHRICGLLLPWVVVLSILLHDTRTCSAQGTRWDAQVSRATFTKRMAKVQRGMSPLQVVALLGPPDEIRGLDADERIVRWCYGVGKESGFPTLGQVWFIRQTKNSQRSESVLHAYGGQDSPPSEKIISEPDLRRLLDVVGTVDFDKTGGLFGWTFDSLIYIRAVNILLPEGKERILVVLSEYFRVWGVSPLENILALIQLLFESSSQQSTVPAFTQRLYYSPGSSGIEDIPDFPIVIIQDVPILMFGNYMNEGIHDGYNPPRQYLQYLRKQGHLRSQPLHPTDQPLEILVKLVGEEGIRDDRLSDYDASKRQAFMHQLLRLLRSVAPETRLYCLAPEQPDVKIKAEQWQQILAEASRRTIRWNPSINDYKRQ